MGIALLPLWRYCVQEPWPLRLYCFEASLHLAFFYCMGCSKCSPPNAYGPIIMIGVLILAWSIRLLLLIFLRPRIGVFLLFLPGFLLLSILMLWLSLYTLVMLIASITGQPLPH